MDRKERLCKAIKKTAWGYVLLYFDINLGTINILPSWLAFILFYQAISNGISEEESSAELLKPIGIILGVYDGILWLLTIFRIPTDTYIIDKIIVVISLYFHFQFLTNLANIAKKYGCEQEKSILIFRTMQTLLLTILAFSVQFEMLYEVSLILIIVQIVIVICICVVLHKFKKSIEHVPDAVFETLGEK